MATSTFWGGAQQRYKHNIEYGDVHKNQHISIQGHTETIQYRFPLCQYD